MDRISGPNYTTVSLTYAGVTFTARQFRDKNLATNTNGTTPNALWFDGVQESILYPVQMFGLVPTDADNTQLYQAIMGLPQGRLLNTQYFRVAGTSAYVPTAGTNSIECEVQGGSGASGGAPATDSATVSAGMGGGGGAWAVSSRIPVATATGMTITVGAAGAPASGATGGNGGASSLGTIVSANGGAGGATILVSTTGAYVGAGGAGGVAGSSGALNVSGLPAGALESNNGILYSSNAGFGARWPVPGGNPTSNSTSSAAKLGNPGGPGIMIIREYS